MSEYELHPERDLTVLVPSRSGSKRVPYKNVRDLGGKPLLQWTLDAAKAANVARIIVSADGATSLRIAMESQCDVHHRKPDHASDWATDFSWVYDLREMIQTPYFAILRPTSPFRTASTIRRAFAALVASKAHSIRAVERVHHPHPAKMWEMIPGSKYMRPIVHGCHPDGTPYHSSPTQSLPAVYKQTSSLEMAQTWVIEGTKTISGYHVAPFFCEELEALSIDTEDDWQRAERHIAKNVSLHVEYSEPKRARIHATSDTCTAYPCPCCNRVGLVGLACECGYGFGV